MEKLKSVFTQEVRAYIYRVLIALGAVVTFYGYMSQQEVALWLGLAIVVLNIMPAANTTTKQ
jgi:hypothetical protein